MRRWMEVGLVVLAVALWGSAKPAAAQTGYFSASAYSSDAQIQNPHPSGDTPFSVAWDGTQYWTASGGHPLGVKLARHGADGSPLDTYESGFDFRSLFTSGGVLYARSYNNRNIWKQTSPGTFTVHKALSGGTLGMQSAVLLNGAGTEYLAASSGTVHRWDLNGSYLGAFALSGFGTQSGESTFPRQFRIAVAGNHLLTYNAGKLNAWDMSGNRVGTTTLTDGGTSGSSDYSFSYANGRVWVSDSEGQPWKGYSISLNAGDTPVVPEPSAALLFLPALAVVAVSRKKRGA